MVIMPSKLDEQEELEKKAALIKRLQVLQSNLEKSKVDNEMKLIYYRGLLSLPGVFIKVLLRKIFGGKNNGKK